MAFTIKELEYLSGIKAHTIRIWEQRYNFLKPSRTQTNIRTYNNDELKTLLGVALLNKYGYKISRIDDMHPDQRVHAILQLPGREAYYENLINEMIGYMIDIKSTEFERLLNKHITGYGIELTITELIFLFLEKVGILWQTNRIIPVQEHIVSNIIRQKLVTAIDNLPFISECRPLFILFLPEGEHHEIGLLYVYYLLRKNGIPVIYLGSNVPLKDVGYVTKVKDPEYLYLHLTSFSRKQNFNRLLVGLSDLAPKAKILLSGSIVQSYKQDIPPNVLILETLTKAISYISSVQNS